MVFIAATRKTNFNIDGIPTELKILRQWVAWRFKYEKDRLKPAKVPIDPKNGKYAKPNNPDTWASFDEAVAAAQKYKCLGVGFVFSRNDPFVGVDLDNVLIDGRLLPEAKAIIDMFPGAYIEVSQSGTGLHIIAKGRISGKGHRTKLNDSGSEIEIYDQVRFFVLTGKHFKG
ncbi:MAG: hypothetical protein HQK57_03875 [Deltaproteobacteria bacterium]|nr:hypothetical protein [Deltaproteobacteria bacterium]